MNKEKSIGASDFNIDLDVKPLGLVEIERSIVKSYRKNIWVKFLKAINEYQMLEEDDKIAVAISGGKDSLLLAKLFQELHKYSKVKFNLEFIAMDPGYSKEVRSYLEDLLAYLNIPAHIYKTDVFEVAEKLGGDKPCYMCARMRRGSLYSKAEELGCNKLALGHHFDDVIETIMLNILCSGNYKTMMPKLKAANFQNMELIRPLYLVDEEWIIKFVNRNKIQALNCSCTISQRDDGSKRADIKRLIKELGQDFKNVRDSIFRSSENVDKGAIVAWKDKDGKHSFLDNY